MIALPDCSHVNEVCFYRGKTVAIEGVVVGDPDRRIEYTHYQLGRIHLGNDEYKVAASGVMLLKTTNHPEYQYGDRLRLTCKLDFPEVTDGFRYDTYLRKEKIAVLCTFPKSLVRTSEREVIWFVQFMVWAKAKTAQVIGELWAEPESSLMAGLLYGSRAGLPKEIMDDFSRTGLTHIIAVSGANMVIIVSALFWVLLQVGFHRRQAYWCAMVGVLLFTVFVGASASVVRAMLMSMIVLTAQHIGRINRIGTALVFSAALMVLHNPFILFSDAGFHLSFLATIGLVYVSPLVTQALRVSRWGRFIEIGKSVSETLAATITTLPLMLYQFGQISLIAPVTNLAITWMIPYLMGIGFVATLVGFGSVTLGRVISFVPGLGMKCVIMLVHWCATWPLSAFRWSMPLVAVISMYCCGIWYVKRKSKSI